MKAIDFHTHIFPPEVRERREELLRRDPCFSELYSNPKAKIATAEDLIRSMDEAEVEISAACNLSWRDLDLCRLTNDYILEAHSRHPRRIVPLGAVPPDGGEDSVREMERCIEGGMWGFGELRIEARDYRGREERFEPVLSFLEEHQIPLLLHCSEPVGHVYPGKGTATPDLIWQIIRKHPKLILICAHWGGGLPFYALMPEVGEALKNVYFDTAATRYLYRFEIFRIAPELVEPEKILFATDFPLLSQSKEIARIRSLNLPRELEEKILWENAQMLLKRVGDERR